MGSAGGNQRWLNSELIQGLFGTCITLQGQLLLQLGLAQLDHVLLKVLGEATTELKSIRMVFGLKFLAIHLAKNMFKPISWSFFFLIQTFASPQDALNERGKQSMKIHDLHNIQNEIIEVQIKFWRISHIYGSYSHL